MRNHKLDEKLMGPALNCITKTKSNKELVKIIEGEQGHPTSKINEEEIKALIEYIKKNCP